MSPKVAFALLVFGLALLELGSAGPHVNRDFRRPTDVRTISASYPECNCPCIDNDVYDNDKESRLNPVALHERDRVGTTRAYQG